MRRLAYLSTADNEPVTDLIVAGLMASVGGFEVVQASDLNEGIYVIEDNEKITEEEGWSITRSNAFMTVSVAEDLFEINVNMLSTLAPGESQ